MTVHSRFGSDTDALALVVRAMIEGTDVEVIGGVAALFDLAVTARRIASALESVAKSLRVQPDQPGAER